MTLYHLKVLAVFLMVVDHLGIVFEITPLRWIGRFAFPLFAYFFVNGVFFTSSHKKYFIRLFGFALISQFPYSVFHILRGIPINLNILFLFVLTYPLLYLIKPCISKRPNYLVIGLSLLIIVYLSRYVDYKYYGVGVILSMYFFATIDYIEAFICWLTVNVYSYLFLGGYQYIVTPLAFLIPYFKQLPLGKKARWFYWFYPLHFIPLSLLKYVASL